MTSTNVSDFGILVSPAPVPTKTEEVIIELSA